MEGCKTDLLRVGFRHDSNVTVLLSVLTSFKLWQ